MSQVGSVSIRPGTLSEIERWYQLRTSRILLQSHLLPGELEVHNNALVEHYSYQRYSAPTNHVPLADAYFGRSPTLIKQREMAKRQTLEHRRSQHRKLAALHQLNGEARTQLIYPAICSECTDDKKVSIL